MIDVILRDRQRCATRQQPQPDLARCPPTSATNATLLPSGDMAGVSSRPTRSVSRCTCMFLTGCCATSAARETSPPVLPQTLQAGLCPVSRLLRRASAAGGYRTCSPPVPSRASPMCRNRRFRIATNTALNQLANARRGPRRQAAEIRITAQDILSSVSASVGGSEKRLSCKRFVHHASERPDVGSLIALKPRACSGLM